MVFLPMFASLTLEGREDSSAELAKKNPVHLFLFLDAVCDNDTETHSSLMEGGICLQGLK